MTRRNIVDVPTSIRSRLLNKSKETKRPFHEVLQYYAMERFLYRLSISSHAKKFFLKGALMFKVWQATGHRPTMDIDLLGRTENNVEALENICRDICHQDISEKDGLVFFSIQYGGKLFKLKQSMKGCGLNLKEICTKR